MSAASTLFGIYAIGFVLVVIASQWMLRGEPTDHGQIVGTQIGCGLALLWPLALIYACIVGPIMAVVWTYHRLRQ